MEAVAENNDEACDQISQECSLSLRQLRSKRLTTAVAVIASHDSSPTDEEGPCHKVLPGSQCYSTVAWDMKDGFPSHPEWPQYKGLTASSSFADFQQSAYKYRRSGCPRTCRDGEKDSGPSEEEKLEEARHHPADTSIPDCPGTFRGKDGNTYTCQHAIANGWAKDCATVSTWAAATCNSTEPIQTVKGEPEMLTKETNGIEPPKHPFQYNGVEWPVMSTAADSTLHIFAVGDWGGLAGALPHDSQIIQYEGGDTRGPHTMGRYRIDPKTYKELCTTQNISDCFASQGQPCRGNPPGNASGEICCMERCGWVKEVDVPAQHLVAEQMKARARTSKPDYILNVGDNFYWGGIYGKCGATPMSVINDVTATQFKWIYEDIYIGEGLDGKPWLSVLGNHDWGGRDFTAAWDQQIAYTWVSDRWVLPAPYWMQRVEYPFHNFSVDIFLIDSNIIDALENNSEEPEHNICSEEHNEADASCSSVDGVPNLASCHSWFQQLWENGSAWAKGKIQNSTADWQILVTHFPCGHKADFYKELHEKYGLDLLVTGHTHKQMMYSHSRQLGGLTCFITGGGGGITSENPPNMTDGGKHDHMYGFYDLVISKHNISIASINWAGTITGNWTVRPFSGNQSLRAKLHPDSCETAKPGSNCSDSIRWAMRTGIHRHPEWFHGLDSSSTFEDFQLNYFFDRKHGCERPCSPGSTTAAENASSCETAENGSKCWLSVMWAKNEGILENPEWFYGLNGSSTFEDFQTMYYDQGKHGCQRPCEPSKDVSTPDCQAAEPFSGCYKKVMWAMKDGIHEHPEWFYGLNSSSEFEEFQDKFFHQGKDDCPKPCKP
eukprot:TRINITY_DN2191_c0_g1_i1.p1 TRINITY_DN2191_c0_g1~~TRINITY_DN2191_c0_g1_i1.p1  ORF type:complete len:871 (+),score=126.83 TRINITY_DN2191_c0_g1_i1:116-2614(+)